MTIPAGAFEVANKYPYQGSNAATEGDWCRWYKNYSINGVINDSTYPNSFLVSQIGGGSAQIQVGNGRAICEGVMMEEGTGANKFFTVPANTSGSTRFDIVCLTCDWTNHTSYLEYVQGGGTLPSLTQTSPPQGNIYQMPLALISAPNGFITITNANIGDCRALAGGYPLQYGGQLTAAATLLVPALSSVSHAPDLMYQVSGATSITTIQSGLLTTSGLPTGTLLELEFLTAGATVISGGNITLKTKKFIANIANASLRLRWNGSSWLEIARSNGNPAGAIVTAATPTVLTNNAWTPITFDSGPPIFDSEGMWSGGALTLLTCQTAGIYRFTGLVDIAANAVGYRGISIVHSALGFVGSNTQNANAAGDTGMNISVDIPMAVAENVQLQVFQNSGGGLNSLVANNCPRLSAFRIGD